MERRELTTRTGKPAAETRTRGIFCLAWGKDYSGMAPWVLVVAALSLAAPHSWTLPCDTLWEWYADEANGGAASCCVEDGAEPEDTRTVLPPPREYAVLVFEGKPRPLPWESVHHTRWDVGNATAVVTLPAVEDARIVLAQAAATLDDDGVPYLLVPQTPLIHFHVFAARDATTYKPEAGYPYAVFHAH